MKGSEAFTSTLRTYLEKRGSKDPLFAQLIKKPGKNMQDCVQYVLNTVKASGCNGFTDDEIYNMAIHYFDEDKIDIGKPVNINHVVVNHKVELTAAEKAEARKQAIEREITREQEKMRKSKEKRQGKDKKEPVEKKDEKKKPETKKAPEAKMTVVQGDLFGQ